MNVNVKVKNVKVLRKHKRKLKKRGLFLLKTTTSRGKFQH